jgi:hypothetical protein
MLAQDVHQHLILSLPTLLMLSPTHPFRSKIEIMLLKDALFLRLKYIYITTLLPDARPKGQKIKIKKKNYRITLRALRWARTEGRLR